jgi:hypothetical protein
LVFWPETLRLRRNVNHLPKYAFTAALHGKNNHMCKTKYQFELEDKLNESSEHSYNLIRNIKKLIKL